MGTASWILRFLDCCCCGGGALCLRGVGERPAIFISIEGPSAAAAEVADVEAKVKAELAAVEVEAVGAGAGGFVGALAKEDEPNRRSRAADDAAAAASSSSDERAAALTGCGSISGIHCCRTLSISVICFLAWTLSSISVGIPPYPLPGNAGSCAVPPYAWPTASMPT